MQCREYGLLHYPSMMFTWRLTEQYLGINTSHKIFKAYILEFREKKMVVGQRTKTVSMLHELPKYVCFTDFEEWIV